VKEKKPFLSYHFHKNSGKEELPLTSPFLESKIPENIPIAAGYISCERGWAIGRTSRLL
jgi:hypothetical protein